MEARLDAVAARNGGDVNANPRLRTAVLTARAASLPNDTIERAIKKGSGQLEGQTLEEIDYEGYGPGGVAVMARVLTDNRNRTISDLRRTFTRSGGNLGENGSVAWQFDTLGYIAAPREGRDDDKIFEMAIEAGAENYEADAEIIEFYTQPGDLHTVSKNLQAAGVKPESVELILKPKNPVSLEAKDAVSVMNVVDSLEELDDVQNVYSALDLNDELMKQLEAMAA